MKKYGDRDANARARLNELQSFAGPIQRPVSPSSSTSSYHSSQASPPDSPPPRTSSYPGYPPPDPDMPVPDVAPGFIPPSSLDHSHRSLLNLLHQDQTAEPEQVQSAYAGSRLGGVPGSRAHSLREGAGRSDPANLMRRPSNMPPPSNAGPSTYNAGQSLYPGGNRGTAYGPASPMAPPAIIRTPELSYPPSPFLGIHQPSPMYPPRPGSVSSFSHVPQHSIPQSLQQIQISLQALHERLSTLERTQSMLLRREARKGKWRLFSWSNEADELDELEEEAERERARWGTATNTATSTRRRQTGGGLSARMLWALLGGIRRAMIDVGMGMMVMLLMAVILGGGWRKARFTLTRLVLRAKRFIQEA